MRIFCCLLVMFSFSITKAQKIAFCYKGEWSSWMNAYCEVAAYTDGSGVVLKTSGGREYFTLQIDNFVPPSKDVVKRSKKNNQWFEYTGTVTYYVSDTYPTALELAKQNVLLKPNPRTDITPVVKRTARATIRVAPFKKAPACYNVWFDDIGIGIDIQGFSFGNKGNGPYGGKKRE